MVKHRGHQHLDISVAERVADLNFFPWPDGKVVALTFIGDLVCMKVLHPLQRILVGHLLLLSLAAKGTKGTAVSVTAIPLGCIRSNRAVAEIGCGNGRASGCPVVGLERVDFVASQEAGIRVVRNDLFEGRAKEDIVVDEL